MSTADMDAADYVDELDSLDCFNEEYSSQFFGFIPKTFLDELSDVVDATVCRSIKKFHKALKDEFPEADLEELESGTEAMTSTASATLDSAFDKLEEYVMKNIFHIPSHVLLPEDEFRRQPVKSEKELDADIKESIQKIKNLKYVNACMEEELRILETVRTEQKDLLATVDKIKKSCQENELLDEDLLKDECVSMLKELGAVEEKLFNS